MEESISKTTMCVTSLGDVIASGTQMLVMALSGQPQNNDVPHTPQVSHPHFNTYRGFASPYSYGNHNIIVPYLPEVLYPPCSTELAVKK